MVSPQIHTGELAGPRVSKNSVYLVGAGFPIIRGSEQWANSFLIKKEAPIRASFFGLFYRLSLFFQFALGRHLGNFDAALLGSTLVIRPFGQPGIIIAADDLS